MRPHRLRVTAFGPFAGTVDLDLDDVSGAGPFLLRGATGAGKTSLLDAVGYALFGKVPGARGLKQLRSDHAAVGVRTSVELWATVGGRAVHVVRTPDQLRPRARGTGTTTDRATVAVRVARDLAALEADDCDARWSGVQEANDELGRLVGMTHEQFVQVVLLPQGDFARFLRAADQDRADVLRALFDTRRFRAVEEHLRRRRDDARDLLAAAASRADAAAERVCARAGGDEVPPSGRAAWAEGLLVEATEAAAAARRSAEVADASEAAARSAHGAAAEVARLLEDLVALAGTEAALLDRAPDFAAAREELAGADRAAGVVALHALSTAAEARSTRALDAARVALDRSGVLDERDQPDAQDLSGELDPADGVRALDASAVQALSERLAARVQAEVDDQARLAALGADVERLREQEARVDASRVAAAAAGAEHESAQEALTTLPGQVAALAAELETARAEAEDVPAALADVARWDGLVTAAAGLVRLVREAGAAERWDLAARAAARDDEDALDALRRARLAGMSAELAAGLEPGEPCPVCGASEHPAPAAPSDGGLGEADEGTARARARSSAAAAGRTGDALAQVAARRDVAHAALVDSAAPEVAVAAVPDLDAAARTALADALGERAEQARRRLADARAAQGRAAAAAVALERARTAHAAAGERLASAAASLAGGHETLRDAEAEALAAVVRLRDGLGDPDGTQDPAALREALLATATDRLARARRAHDAVLALHAGLGEADRARQAAVDAATGAGWADVAEAVVASRPRAWCDRTRREVADHERALHAAEAGVAARRPALTEVDVRVEATSGHDLVREAGRLAADATERQQELGLRLAGAVAAARDAGAVLARAADARDGLRRDVPALLAAEQGTGRLRDEAEAARALADLCSGANDKGTALSTYVLAAHLEQVVEAANLRLVTMSEGRYALVHVEEGEDRRRRAGLGLAVLDAWTGTRRPAGTLSGGETFLASLALALGLADVVAAEAGGARVDALFVDEGFGTLDPDSLDRAMDVLDQLQEHGRMVGVVSHVGELRQRLPRQVVVEAGRSGSTVRVATG